MGHLVRACAVAKALLPEAEPIIVSMAPGIADVGAALGIGLNTFLDVIVNGCRDEFGIIIYEID